MSNELRRLFLLDDKVHFLNHGSFGACPRSVFKTYQAWQRRLEGQPVLFLGRQLVEFDQQARQVLGTYLHTAAQNLAFIPNATHGVNIIARSLTFGPGDEILSTDHE
jgi:isopenicillin-N epimerase